ncbi:hypothetical protein [Blastopirellula marina]|uniref:Tetratricopeptide repeat protein n=1 Tax=Blastopirellula marina TaxID=124 RepID=A0A2S8G6T6_9BACT|nr:hypothetical protein [Blastopirellula marina]PQO40133.1 hypothetical protein C5Y98_05875 [Blastopirellula marina]PTL45500.1 hypothetical protein C5Y97_05875 [Blastopirellula marina]
MQSRSRLLAWLAVVTLCCFAIRPSLAQPPAAPRPAALPSLLDAQLSLTAKYKQALDSLDFAGQQAALREMRQVTAANAAEPKFYSLAELDFMLHDLSRRDAFTAEQQEVARQQQSNRGLGMHFAGQGNLAMTIESRRTALEAAQQLYGDQAHATLDAQLLFALSLSESETEPQPDGYPSVQLAQAVLVRLENLRLTDSLQYREALRAVMFIHINHRNYPDAAKLGESYLAACERAQLTATTNYLDGLADVANVLNRDQRYAEARDVARKGLNRNFELTRQNGPSYLNLMHDYAYACIGLQDYAKVPQAYDTMLQIADQLPRFPPPRKLELLTEYQWLLKRTGDQRRLAEIERQIAELQTQLPPREPK